VVDTSFEYLLTVIFQYIFFVNFRGFCGLEARDGSGATQVIINLDSYSFSFAHLFPLNF